ncbi:MAG: ATP-dependent DNA helicase RecG [Bacillota bacterium]|nr:ATP-dependent DNA helicase RecG [Bacillota bacterium]
MKQEELARLDQPVTVLSGVGPKRAQQLKKLGLETVRDVLFSFPRSYKDFQRVLQPHEVEVGEDQLVHGPLFYLQERTISGGRRLIQASLGGILTLTWFVHHRGRGTSYLYRRLERAKELWVYGAVKEGFSGLEMASPEFFVAPPPHQGLMPVYPLVSGISNQQRIAWARYALKFRAEVGECLPAQYLTKYMGRSDALLQLHFPSDWKSQRRARERFVFEEFFLFHLNIQRGSRRSKLGVAHRRDGSLVRKYRELLPFSLTQDQERALEDVRADMESSRPMRRLIQGDVGSGKTVVAEYGAVKAVESGGQAAIMVPTEVLARQMAARLQKSLGPLGIRVELLVSGLPAKEQKRVRQAIEKGMAQVVVGTHALITDKVQFNNLTLAVVDEQHRFGVRQRAALLGKGNADLLVMSATPIPRSLALTLYGDLETTEIRQLPRGRKKVDTRLIDPKQREEVYRYLVSRVKQGDQAFVVFPLVEESEHLEAKAAVQEMEELRAGLLADVRVGLIHGQMGKEKDDVFRAFYEKEIDVLIATTVIEVGMDVPNATVMVIENAERFGLAQLHQLRGRVGRGEKPGICFLLAYSYGENTRARLDVIRRSTDGFYIAEQDLQLRGPGDLFGVRQWGQPIFNVADLQEDREMLELSAAEANKLLQEDPELRNHPKLKAELERQRL